MRTLTVLVDIKLQILIFQIISGSSCHNIIISQALWLPKHLDVMKLFPTKQQVQNI